MEIAHTHTLNLRELPESKTKDKLFVRFNAVESRIRSEREARDVSVYDCINYTKRSANEVAFWREGSVKRAGCSCESRVVCKHILRSLIIHVARKAAAQRVAA